MEKLDRFVLSLSERTKLRTRNKSLPPSLSGRMGPITPRQSSSNLSMYCKGLGHPGGKQKTQWSPSQRFACLIMINISVT